jgi:hypothetical protein
MGTSDVKGEDNESKGAVFLFEVAHLEVMLNWLASAIRFSHFLQLQSDKDVLFRLKQR